MKPLIFLVFLLFTPVCSKATTYYISNSGSDSNTGKSNSVAWKTIAKLNSSWAVINPGDSILFRSGDTFRGMISPSYSGFDNMPIVISSYGTGQKPIISGSVVVSNWTLHSGNIWKADLTGLSANAIESIYADKVLLSPARYPNTDYYFTSSAGNNYTLNCLNLTQSTGYWVGANVIHRIRNWVWDRNVVTGSSNGQITTTNAFLYATQTYWGFYFTNKLSFLDVPGEWYYDNSTKTMYAWFPNNANPNTLTVEVPIYENRYGILFNYKNNFSVQNLTFTNGAWGGIRAQYSNNISIKNCKFSKISGVGIVSNFSNNPKIHDNTFENTINSAVSINTNRNYEVLRNIIRQCGRETSYIDGYDRFGITSTKGVRGKICYNKIDSVGSSGINLADSLTLIEKNTINYSCAEITDNGGIYVCDAGKSKTTTSIYGDTIRNNFISNNTGNLGGTMSYSSLVQGMDISDFSGNCVIDNNTIYANLQYGIKVFGGFNNKIRYNTIFGNGDTQFAIGTKASLFATDLVANNLVKNNLMVSNNEEYVSMKLYSDGDIYNFGVYDSNYYYNPYGKYTYELNYGASPNTQYRNNFLSRWRVFQPTQDANSREISPFLSHYNVNSLIGSNLITNGDFDTNCNGWSSTTTTAWVNSGGISNGTFREGASNSGIIYTRSNTFNIVNGKTYQVKISCKAERAAKLQLSFLKLNFSTVLSNLKYVEISPEIKNYTFILKANASASDAQLGIITIDDDVSFQYYIDNVEVKEALTTPILSDNQIKLFSNPSDQVVTISGINTNYTDIETNTSSTSFQIQPWKSRVMLLSEIPLATVRISTNNPNIRIYPNPVCGLLNIEDRSETYSCYDILNSRGQVISIGKLAFPINSINVKTITDGLYIVRLYNSLNKNIYSQKIIVKND